MDKVRAADPIAARVLRYYFLCGGNRVFIKLAEFDS
jgi:hypothetical protein